jgi:hypothetical protein
VSLQFPLFAIQGNDTAYYLNVTLNGKPLNLTLYTIKAYQKASATSTDASGTTYLVGSGLTVLNAALGQLRLIIPHANVATPGTQWWRLDIIDANSAVYTVFYGPLTIKAA